MQDNRRLALGILLAALLVVFVIFAGITAMAEGFQLDDSEDIPLATDTASPQPGNTQDTAGEDGVETALPAFTNTSAPDVSLSTEIPTGTFTPIAGACAYPAEWIPIALSVGNTLEDVAATYNTTVDELVAGNCLPGADVQPGTLLYVPPAGMPSSTAQSSQDPTKTSTSAVATCGAPASWVKYRIRSGDTLFSLAQAYGTTITQLQYANCLGSSTQIITGNDLYVPNVSQTNTPLAVSPTTAPTNTPTPSYTPSPTLDATATAVAATSNAATATSAAATSVSADATATSVAATAISADATSTAAVPPTLNIDAPVPGNTGSTTVTFTGTATDAVDDDTVLSGTISWSSDVDGPIGTGASITVTTLTAGGTDHVITASVTDSAGMTTTQTVNITVP